MNFAAGTKRERRLYENAALVAVRQERVIGLLWTRRGRKSTTLGNIAFDELSGESGRTVIAASASLLLGTELVSQAVTATEQAIVVGREALAMREALGWGAQGKGLDLQAADAETGKVHRNISDDDFADLYQSKKLELRLYFDRTNYSRLMVIAPNPATARGWGGTVLRDEVGFTRAGLETELQIAVDPIFRTDPRFKMIYASNLPRDDRHPWFEMTLPPAESEFPAQAQGHFYRGQNSILIHRVSLADAYAAGHVLYDNRGQPMTLDEFRRDPANRIQLPGSYDLIHSAGGTAVVDLMALLSAQKAGAKECAFLFVDDDRDFQRGMQLLRDLVTDGTVGIGVDVASTTGDTSNPTSVTIMEKKGVERRQRVVLVWKEKREATQRDRLRQIVQTLRARPDGGPARRMCIDGSNERLFAEGTQAELAGLIPVQVIVSGATVDPAPPGYTESINYKTYLGDLYSAAINGGTMAMPPDEYIKQDHRLTVKNGGRYECDPQPDGKHGDTFDSGKLAEFALMATGGALESTEGITLGGRTGSPRFRAKRLRMA
jgi:hypothetical protein